MSITPPKCKTCGKVEWRHVCAGPAPTLKEVRDATAALERAFPSPAGSAKIVEPHKGSDTIDVHGRQAVPIETKAQIRERIAGSSNGRTAAFDTANVGSSPAPASKLKRARKALTTAEAKAAPLKPKKRKPRMAKAGRKPVKTDARSLAARKRMADRRAADKLKGGTAKAPKPEAVKP